MYLLAIHVTKVGGRRYVKKCYLGPAESYEYVFRLHIREQLVFHGLPNDDRDLEYLLQLPDVLPELVKRRIELGKDVRNLDNVIRK